MKRFITTLAGKTVTFIVCVISLCIFAVSTAGIFLYSQFGFDFYAATEDELRQELLVDYQLRSNGYIVLRDVLSMQQNPDSGYEPEFDVNYQITDGDGNVTAESLRFSEAETSYALSYAVVRDSEGNITDVFYHTVSGPDESGAEYYTVRLSLIEGTSTERQFGFVSALLHTAYSLRYAIFLISFVSLLLAIASFIALMYAAGRRPDTDELCAGPLYRVPYDLLCVFCIFAGVLLCFAGDSFTNSGMNGPGLVVCISGLCVVGLNILLGMCMSAAGRIKQHTFVRNTLIFRILMLIRKMLGFIWRMLCGLHRFNMSLIRGLPLVWKTGLVFCAVSVFEIILVAADEGEAAGILFAEKLVLLPLILYTALLLRRLQKSGAALANGDLSYHTDTGGMFWDFRQHGENLNSIADGMAIAVDEHLKSERMKTELITNVSHDIKTPLTSIINYASLIGGETCDNPRITEYSEVLVRQSEKLKRLIEDLVEASKASTGNLEVLPIPCDAAVFITQAAGEYEEKLSDCGLSLITKQPEKELRIMADGRRMWRIFDNLMNNICKYGQPGTRVYLSLEEQDKNAVITFKNTSRDPLDMPEEELMERFTRGDSARSTEGNGLGLSIAKSMAELQGGSLKLAIDGDLFKAVLSFPLI